MTQDWHLCSRFAMMHILLSLLPLKNMEVTAASAMKHAISSDMVGEHVVQQNTMKKKKHTATSDVTIDTVLNWLMQEGLSSKKTKQMKKL